MAQLNDLSRSLVPLEPHGTLVAVIEMSQSSWLAAGIVPGIERQPAKKLEPDPAALLRLLRRWQDEAARAGKAVTRIAVAFEAGRDGFWLARWLRAREIEAHVIHATSVAVSREHRRAKTDRLDTELLKRAFLGWLRAANAVIAAWPRLATRISRVSSPATQHISRIRPAIRRHAYCGNEHHPLQRCCGPHMLPLLKSFPLLELNTRLSMIAVP